jgi:hypothetical protein
MVSSFALGYPTFPAPFVEKTFPLNYLGTLSYYVILIFYFGLTNRMLIFPPEV